MLVKHCNFTYQDVKTMTGIEREDFINLFIEEQEKEKKALDDMKT